MKDIIATIFDTLAIAFDKIPLLKKFDGYRSCIFMILLGVTYGLEKKGLLPAGIAAPLEGGFLTLTGLALNAKGRE